MRAQLAIFGILAAAVSFEAAAAQSAKGAAGTQISEQAGITVVQDVLTNVNASVLVIGTPGDTVSMAVPASVSLSSPSGQSMNLGTATELSSGNLLLSGDSVSVSIGALGDGQSGATPGSYDGVMVVLAQYN
jgi:hypothetical protein